MLTMVDCLWLLLLDHQDYQKMFQREGRRCTSCPDTRWWRKCVYRRRARKGVEGAPPSQELPPSIQHITPPCYSSPIVVSSPGLKRRLEVGTGSIKIPSIWSQDSQLTYCPQQIYTTRGAIFEEENDENRISQRKGNKKRTWQKNQQIENCKIKNSPLLHFLINSKDIHYQGWVSKFSLRTLEKANQWPDYRILDTFKTCLLIGLSKINHDIHDNWQCIDIAMENVCPVA